MRKSITDAMMGKILNIEGVTDYNINLFEYVYTDLTLHL